MNYLWRNGWSGWSKSLNRRCRYFYDMLHDISHLRMTVWEKQPKSPFANHSMNNSKHLSQTQSSKWEYETSGILNILHLTQLEWLPLTREHKFCFSFRTSNRKLTLCAVFEQGAISSRFSFRIVVPFPRICGTLYVEQMHTPRLSEHNTLYDASREERVA